MGFQEEREVGVREIEGRGGWGGRYREVGAIKNLVATVGNTQREWTVGPALDIWIGPCDSVGGRILDPTGRNKGRRGGRQINCASRLAYHMGVRRWDVTPRLTARGGGGSALAVADICNPEREFRGCPGRERVQRIHVLRRHQREASRDLLLETLSDRKKIQ